MVTLDTEIRKLQPAELCALAQILNQSDSWKKLMAIVPKETTENHYMFNNEHFVMIEQAIRQQQRSGADIFLSEWSTLNKKRPTCRLMLDLLIKAELFRAADYLAVDILKTEPPERPKTGPAAPIDVSEKALEELLKQQVDDLKIEREPEDMKTWSLRFKEKPTDVMQDQNENIEKNLDRSDLIKFDSDGSDLMKFSVSDEEVVRDLPPQMSDLMKFSSIKADDEFEPRNYVLQEARSEDIPLCVRENVFQSSKNTSSINENLESSTSIESSDILQSTMSNEQIYLPNISQNIIPIVVLEYNEKEKNDT